MVAIRDATDEDWPAMWAFMAPIVRAGETYCYDISLSSAQLRDMWMQDPPGATLVAVDDAGAVLGTAEIAANRPGGGAHVANASFMVDAAASGRGVGRALGEAALQRARAGGFRSMQFNAVVETNTHAVALWQSLGFEILATIPEGFRHPTQGYVGLHVMFRTL
jgi:L-amino acid N-acyltransferase YncA